MAKRKRWPVFKRIRLPLFDMRAIMAENVRDGRLDERRRWVGPFLDLDIRSLLAQDSLMNRCLGKGADG